MTRKSASQGKRKRETGGRKRREDLEHRKKERAWAGVPQEGRCGGRR